MSDYEIGKDIAEIKRQLNRLEELLESALNYEDPSNKGSKQPQLAGGNGGPTGRPN